MRYVAAYLLAVLGGNKNPSAKDLEKILGSVGIEVESEQLTKVIKELGGKDLNELMEAGKAKLASMPVGGGVAVTGGTGGGSGTGGSAPAAEEKKEEAKEESEESEDDDMGFGLFD
ncbi:60S acidic ribosomal protein P2-like [Limulus polyphemus]|uniref:Large ribosomal subunit protein P2 n=1 Tax=Limulus polyphemus TaxID=6850 RepID=A0ABM1BG35_LIMPO|nr:60S acidic ribosomal protein P2-like [Limulus polyphemus]